MCKNFFFLFIIIFSFLLLTSSLIELWSVSAEEDEIIFRRPQKILLVQLNTENPYITSDIETWMNLFEYYSATRLGLREVPFANIVDRQGQVVEGIDDPEGTAQYMENQEGVVLVGYLSQSSDITLAAQKSLKEIFQGHSRIYGISKEQVQVVDLSLRTFEDEPPFFEHSLRDDILTQNLSAFVDEVDFSEDPQMELVGEITDLQYSGRVNVGNTLEVNLSLKNNDDFTWYIDDGMMYLSTADSEDSSFAINEDWKSFSIPLVVQSQIIPSGEELDVSFNLGAEFMPPGNYSESFNFILLPDNDVDGTEFNVDFQVVGNGEEVVEVRRSGGLTVFDCPSHTCEDVGTVEDRSRHLVLDEENRWYKINVRGIEGWIAGNYVSRVN